MTSGDDSDPGVRLQKVLAASGLGSRRFCETLISRGRVSVDGVTVTEQGVRVHPDRCIIRVDGAQIPTAEDLQVFVLNKPVGVLSTMADPQGRPCLGDLVAEAGVRLFHVGRLDADTEGLLLLTNDGELAHRLTHPAHGVTKTYLARVRGELSAAALRRIRQGVAIDGRPVHVHKVRVKATRDGQSLVEVTISEGRNRIVRRLFEEVGHPVEGLVRTRLGPLGISGLRPGQLRRLHRDEIRELYAAAQL